MRYIYIIVLILLIISFAAVSKYGLRVEKLRHICGGGISINDTEIYYNESRILYNSTK